MFTLADMRGLLNARPFVPFRLIPGVGGSVVVKSRGLAVVARRFAVVVILDPDNPDGSLDRWQTIWPVHVTRVEMLIPGQPPFSPPGATESPAPSPV
jgi:hypothetical protein